MNVCAGQDLLDYLAETGAEHELDGFRQKAFEGLMRLVPCESACLLWLDSERRVLPQSIAVGIDAAYLAAYTDLYRYLDFVVASLPLDQWPASLDYRPEFYRHLDSIAASLPLDLWPAGLDCREAPNVEYYEGFIRPQRWAMGCSIYLRDRQGRPRTLLTFNRHRRDRFTQQEIDLLWRLRPHLENLHSGLQTIAELQAWQRYLDEAAADCRPLSKREAEVAALLCRGLKLNEIAARLLISPLTAKKHTENIYGKLGVNNRRELAGRLMGGGNGS